MCARSLRLPACLSSYTPRHQACMHPVHAIGCLSKSKRTSTTGQAAQAKRSGCSHAAGSSLGDLGSTIKQPRPHHPAPNSSHAAMVEHPGNHRDMQDKAHTSSAMGVYVSVRMNKAGFAGLSAFKGPHRFAKEDGFCLFLAIVLLGDIDSFLWFVAAALLLSVSELRCAAKPPHSSAVYPYSFSDQRFESK